MKKLIAIASVLALCLSLAACGGGAAPTTTAAGGTTTAAGGSTTAAAATTAADSGKGKVLVVAASQDPVHFNSNATTDATGYPRFNIFSNLFNRTQGGDTINDLVKDYEISADGLTYTMQLHENILWHDGTPFSSEDVKFTYETHLREKGVQVERFQAIETIECPDANTVIFKLSHVDADLRVSMVNVDILPKHLYEGTDWLENPANQSPIGTGPYKFVEHKKGQSITLVANPDYFKGVPEIDKLIYKIIPDANTMVQAYLNGEIDVMDAAAAVEFGSMPLIEADPGSEYVVTMGSSRQYVVPNQARGIFDDLKIRQAIALAVDKQAMVDLAHKGYAYPCVGFYTPTVPWAYTEDFRMPDRDVATANQLMDEAGFPADASGVRIKDMEIVIFEFAAFHDLATVLQSNLKEIGIECSITMLEYSAWSERMEKGDFDLSIISGNHGPSPANIKTRLITDGSMNYGGYSNTALDKLFDDVAAESDEAARGKIMYEIQRILHDDMPVMYLTEWCGVSVVKDYVKNHYSFDQHNLPWGCFFLADIVD